MNMLDDKARMERLLGKESAALLHETVGAWRRGEVPKGYVLVDRARFERLAAIVEELAADPGSRLRDSWAAMQVFDAFDALQPGDRDPLP